MIVLVVVLGVAGWAWLDAIGGADAVRERFGLNAAVVIVPLMAVVAASPAPSEPVAIINGLIYGTVWGAPLNWLGWMLAGVLASGGLWTWLAAVIGLRGKLLPALRHE